MYQMLQSMLQVMSIVSLELTLADAVSILLQLQLQWHAMAASCCYLVLEDPVNIFRGALAFWNHSHELILPKASVDKSIDKRGGQVLSGRVHSRT